MRDLPEYRPNYGNQLSKDAARRVNAGGQKAGLPLIITGGQKRYDIFHYNFSDKGKIGKRPKQGEDPIPQASSVQHKRDIAHRLKFKLPRNFCADCNRTDREHEKGAINVWNMTDGFQEAGLYPDDVVVTFWCQKCQMNALWGKKIALPGDEKCPMPPEDLDDWRKKQIRHCRMDRNIAEYIRSAILRQDWSIIVDEETRERLASA